MNILSASIQRGWGLLVTAVTVVLLNILAVSDGTAADATGEESSAKAVMDKVVQRLVELRPGIPIEDVYPVAIPGLYGVDIAGGSSLYVSEDGRYLIAGDLFSVGSDLVNVSELRRDAQRVVLMESVAAKDKVVFPADGGEAKTYVHIFTDVDCGYCRKLHEEIGEYNSLGIEVRYLAYPRAGMATETADKMISVWCSDNPHSALTKAKQGKFVAKSLCDSPVESQFELGQLAGVSGTPSIITEDGKMLPGYLPAADLAKALGLQKVP